MAKKLSNKTFTRRIGIIIAFVATGFATILWLYNFGPFSEYSDMTSRANAVLIEEAKQEGDISICEKIRGGIREGEVPSIAIPPKGDPFVYRQMSEAQTRERCRNDVMQEIERNKYK